ncbi:WXG100 family type VII secretion target [Flexivirga meconopsidis]|uniref:WXG100 family type VII secretion target n=1 Tax=Flexivirga meconopsidis TaxID=2977121 RepID=UPI00223FDCC6|nr:WXG100 family type VII secretion target [Flexivirga meconopsidis]
MQPSGTGAYAVDSNQLDQHSRDVANVAEEIAHLMGVMDGKLHALQGTWKGQASGQYAQLHGEWKAAQTKVRTALTDIGLALGSASTAYSQVEADVTRAFTPK